MAALLGLVLPLVVPDAAERLVSGPFALSYCRGGTTEAGAKVLGVLGSVKEPLVSFLVTFQDPCQNHRELIEPI